MLMSIRAAVAMLAVLPGIAQTSKSLTAVNIGSDGIVHIVRSDGSEFIAPKEKDQVSSSSSKIADDKSTAGWLVNYENCCTSYPIPLTLIVYRPGRPLHKFGDGMSIGDWSFWVGGKQVAFYTNTVHGGLAPHYELHDVRTGRLIEKWEGHPDSKSPAWVHRLRSE